MACGLKDGMTVSFHHHFRDGDFVVNMVMQEIVALGLKDITIAASSRRLASAGFLDSSGKCTRKMYA